ncbi:MAG TPA: hydroxyacid dehydrogenase [Anaerolineales bacterium]|jgi:D-3-phosphoglycerate dehydrogenase|nr:hydroxyacid dehydrogenase [Anaerolineales bacterium]
MTQFKILITDGLDQSGLDILRSQAEVDNRKDISADDLLKAIPEYNGLIVRGRTKVTASVLDAATRLKAIGRAGVGVDNIDLNAAKKRNVTVVNAPMSTSIAVAELTFGLLLALAREIPRADAGMKQGKWLKKELEGAELNGKTLGVIGFGRIGMELGKRAAAFGMSVVAYDPLISEDEIAKRGAEPVSIQDLYAWSDFISLHLPLNVQTRDMIGPLAFSQMKNGARIVCAARGGIIDEAALVAALNSGKVAGAALDVYAVEPPGETEAVLHPKVIAMPHIGAQTAEAQSRASEDIANEVLSALLDKPLRWKVN